MEDNSDTKMVTHLNPVEEDDLGHQEKYEDVNGKLSGSYT
jgi:hypothetical protein